MNELLENVKVHVTTHADGSKMDGFRSISTTCDKNKFCEARINAAKKILAALEEEEEKAKQAYHERKIKRTEYSRIKKEVKEKKNTLCVCAFCYSHTTQEMRPSLREALTKNCDILRSRILRKDELPFIFDLYFRFESFGDIENDIQLLNYIEIAKFNPRTTFALWTKNLNILDLVFDTMQTEKPDNLIIVFSSYHLNKIDNIQRDYIDYIFTVWSSEEKAAEHGQTICCGKKQCKNCLHCYTKGNERLVNELKK